MNWVLANLPITAGRPLAHLLRVVPTIIASFVPTIPITRLARMARLLRAVLVTGSSLLYIVPSLALFTTFPIVLAIGIRNSLNVIVALTLCGLALLAPAITDTFDAIDARMLDVATAMGMGCLRYFLTAELPLAGPTILTGLYVVTVPTISLITVEAVLDVRSLGWLLTGGLRCGITTEVVTGLVVTVALAFILDGLVLILGRPCLPRTQKRVGNAGAVPAGACAAASNSQGGKV